MSENKEESVPATPVTEVNVAVPSSEAAPPTSAPEKDHGSTTNGASSDKEIASSSGSDVTDQATSTATASSTVPTTSASTAATEDAAKNDSSNDNTKKSTASPSPEINPASAVEGGREISNNILYVGSLHKSISEDSIKDLFAVSGPESIQSIKVLNDKNKLGFNYAFIEFDSNQSATSALEKLNGTVLNNTEIKINWAFQSSNVSSEQASNGEPTFNIFVGDLSPEVDDESLNKAFSKYESLKSARVMWDMQTSRSRGYGFVNFSNQQDAELALQTMNGEWICGRAIRCNWASHKQMQNQGQGQGHQNRRNGGRFNNNNNNNNHNNHKYNNNNNNGGPYKHYQTPQFEQMDQFQQHQQHQQQHLPPQQLPPHSPHPSDPSQQDQILQQQQQHHHQQQQPQLQHQQQQQQQYEENLPRLPGGGQRSDKNGNNGNVDFQQQQQQHQQPGQQQPGPQNQEHQLPPPAGAIPVMSPQSYDIVLRQTPSWQTTVYLGNIAHFTQQGDLIPLLQNFGYIVDFKFHPERGCAFVKYDSHERAALAIVQLAGFNVNGRPLKCGWGKDRPPMNHQYNNFRGVPPPQMYQRQ